MSVAERSSDVANALSLEPSSAPRRACVHCGGRTTSRAKRPFCCDGCEAVWEFLHGEGLERYYELRGPVGVAAVTAGEEAAARVDHKWLEPIARSLASRRDVARVELDIQGMHCSACVWLVDELFRREAGGVGVVVNPAVGRAELTVLPTFDLGRFVAAVERVGYHLGPPVKGEARGPDDLLWRMGVCVAIAMNAMIFEVARYAGLADGETYRLFRALTFGLSALSVLVGGTVFFRSAIRALRARVLHLDLPIAVGIALAFASSAYGYAHGASSTYFDTLDVFVALMLVGRFLQERVLLRNRADILASSGAEHVYTRRVAADGRVELVLCKEIEAGDRLVVARADLVPVDATLESAGSYSLDWVSGESRPRRYEPGETVPAGAFSCNEGAAYVRAVTPFDASGLATLLRGARERAGDAARATPFWTRLSKVYVVSVLALAAITLAGWLLVTGDVQRASSAVTALLIVTCPCAFGIAAPLAYELAQAGLRRVGLFVRSPAFLDRAASVRKVVLDKTGTLTTGTLTLSLSSREAIADLDDETRGILYALSSQSAHPKSRAVCAALDDASLTLPSSRVQVEEHPGFGVSLTVRGEEYRLGAPSWALDSTASSRSVSGVDVAAGVGSAALGARARLVVGALPNTPALPAPELDEADVVFAEGGTLLAPLTTREELRPDAAEEVRTLQALGLEVYVLSGDAEERVHALAAYCGVPSSRAFAERSPAGKAKVVAALDRGDLLFVGDGINDALACDAATCSGTPAVDRPFMAARSDFYVVAPGIRPLRTALTVARRLARVVRVTLGVALAYNLVAVTLAVSGLMTPLLCAVLMPLSSLSTVAVVTASLGRRSATWRS